MASAPVLIATMKATQLPTVFSTSYLKYVFFRPQRVSKQLQQSAIVESGNVVISTVCSRLQKQQLASAVLCFKLKIRSILSVNPASPKSANKDVFLVPPTPSAPPCSDTKKTSGSYVKNQMKLAYRDVVALSDVAAQYAGDHKAEVQHGHAAAPAII